jgi:hypothetical protein
MLTRLGRLGVRDARRSISSHRSPRRLRLETLEPRTLMAVIHIDDPDFTFVTFGDSGSPFIDEGQALDLSQVTFEGNSDGVTFGYDFDGDFNGTTGLEIEGLTDPATTVDWSVLSQTLDNGPSETEIRVFAMKDGAVLVVEEGEIDVEIFGVTTLAIANTTPEITSFSVFAGGGCGGSEASLSVSFTDPGLSDSHTITVNWGDGSEEEELTRNGANGSYTASANHSFVTPGAHNVSITIEDTDLDIAEDEVNVPEGGGGGGPQSVCLDGGLLLITGSGGDDVDEDVVVTSSGGNIRVEASFLPGPDQFLEFPAASVTQIQAVLGAGDDVFFVANSVNRPVVASGGAGNDILTGGPGRSILIGGTGSDLLYGGGGQDLLIGGNTDFDSNAAALLDILDEWTSSHTLEERVRNIVDGSGTTGGGLNGAYYLTDGPSGTVHNDGAIDVLIGGAGTDWLFLNGLLERLLALGSGSDLIGDDLETLFD